MEIIPLPSQHTIFSQLNDILGQRGLSSALPYSQKIEIYLLVPTFWGSPDYPFVGEQQKKKMYPEPRTLGAHCSFPWLGKCSSMCTLPI